MAVSEVEFTDKKLTEFLAFSTKEDLESLLKLAEELKVKCDLGEKEIEKKKRTLIILALLGGFIVLLNFIYIFITYETVDEAMRTFRIILPITAVIMATAVIYIEVSEFRLIRRLRKNTALDKLALKEVLQLLRETSEVTADKENWSVLARAEFRIRLSRFNLEEMKSNFSYF